MAHDQWFFFLASALGKIGYISQPLVAYVQHGQNTYGWSGTTHNSTGARTAMSVKIWNYFATNPEYFSQHGEILRRLSVVLALVKLEVDGKWTERAGQAAETYQRVADAYCGRARIYTSSSFRKRLSAFRQVLGTDAYGDGLIFGSRSFIKDLCVGVPIGPFVTGRLLF
jgi:hypothetical protein